MDEDNKPLQYYKFVINEKAYCYWDWDMRDRVLTFLEGVDPSYFTYLAKVHADAFDDEAQEQHAALALRAAYAQALETLFAFIGATLQAPGCIPAWLTRYQNPDLDGLIDKISSRQAIYSATGHRSFTWEQVSEHIHEHFALEDKEKEQDIKNNFGRLWQRLASDFRNEHFSREYNSIKHGFRARPGGFMLAFGIEEQPGVAAPAENMRLVGKSDFGSSFLVPEAICEAKKDRHHFRLKRQSINWNPEDMVYGLHLIAMSLHNILTSLKIAHGVDAESLLFQWPSDNDAYEEPWKRHRTMGFSAMGWFEYAIPEAAIDRFSQEEILALYKEKPETS